MGGSGLPAADRSAQLGERRAQIRIGDLGEALIERLCLALRQRSDDGPSDIRRKWQWPLHERQAGDRGTAEKMMDAFDDNLPAVLQRQRGAGRGPLLRN